MLCFRRRPIAEARHERRLLGVALPAIVRPSAAATPHIQRELPPRKAGNFPRSGSVTPGNSTGMTRKPWWTQSSRASRSSSLCHGAIPLGPMNTAHVRELFSACSSPSCHGSPGTRCHLSRKGCKPNASSSRQAKISTDRLSALLWERKTSNDFSSAIVHCCPSWQKTARGLCDKEIAQPMNSRVSLG